MARDLSHHEDLRRARPLRTAANLEEIGAGGIAYRVDRALQGIPGLGYAENGGGFWSSQTGKSGSFLNCWSRVKGRTGSSAGSAIPAGEALRIGTRNQSLGPGPGWLWGGRPPSGREAKHGRGGALLMQPIADADPPRPAALPRPIIMWLCDSFPYHPSVRRADQPSASSAAARSQWSWPGVGQERERCPSVRGR